MIKKISLRVGGKDLTLNEDSKSFLPMRNPEDIPSNLSVEYANPFQSQTTGSTITLRNYMAKAPAIIRFMNHECEGVCVGIDMFDIDDVPISGMYYHHDKVNSDSPPSLWMISHREDGIYIGKTRVTDIKGNWILK